MISKAASTEEDCALCDRTVPQGALVLRKKETGKCICIPCLVEIAELTIKEPPKATTQEIKPDAQS